jgi:polysaccharide pyruvyl transferase WcaK-like protein
VDRRVVTIGTGVEDPDWSSQHTLTDSDEIKHWGVFLRTRFDRVTVRGPRSAATLHELGIDAPVVGDPALLLAPSQPCEAVREGDVVINVGASGPIWGTQSQVNSHVRDLARELIRRGFQIRFLIMWERDRNLAESLAIELPTNATRLVAPRTPSDLMRELSSAHVVIGQRLHSVVLAAAAHTPSISLAYRPKCLDFQESINRTRFALRTDQLDTASLVDLTLEVTDNRDAESQTLQHSVTRLRTALNTEIAECRALFSSGQSEG